jgi:hypothetical protein
VLFSCKKDRPGDDSSSSSQSSSSSSSSSQQGTDDSSVTPPQAVRTAFAAKFGNTPVRQWKLRNDGTYRAHFTWNNVAWEATYTANGTLVKSEPA